MWRSCAAALDACTYFMPYMARRIMKLDLNNNDAMSSVEDDLGDGFYKYIGTVVFIDRCVYGIPFCFKRIEKYDPINYINSTVGKVTDESFNCTRGTLARDGCIYALAVKLKIDTTNNSHDFVGNIVKLDHDNAWNQGWCDAIL